MSWFSLVLMLGGAFPTSGASEEGAPLAFVGFHVVTMNGKEVLRDQTVVVQGGEIYALGDRGEVVVPAGARVVEGRVGERPGDEGSSRRYLLPGLCDTHVHYEADEMGELFLLAGVTTVFNLRGSPEHQERFERIRRGALPGPTVYTSGPFVNQPDIQTPADARESVAEHVQRGYDFIKIHGDLTRETFEALADAAAEHHLAVTGHAPRNLPYRATLEVGQVWIAHAEELIYTHFGELDVEAIDELVPAIVDAEQWITPTLSTFDAIVRQWGRPEVVEAAMHAPDAALLSREGWQHWTESNSYTGRDATSTWPQRALDFQMVLVARLHAAGVRLMLGTDTPLPLMMPGQSVREELEKLLACGLDHEEALAAATRQPGEFTEQFIDPDAFFGRIEIGYRADLLVLEQDPLADCRIATSPTAVVLRGVYHDAEELRQRRAAILARNR